MKIDANDPRWTAYALHELENERDRAEIEAVLKESAEARLLIEEIRNAAGWLAEGLQLEPAVNLSAMQRQRIIAGMEDGRGWFDRRRTWILMGAAAAALVIAVLAGNRIIRHGSELTPVSMPPEGPATAASGQTSRDGTAAGIRTPLPPKTVLTPPRTGNKAVQNRPETRISHPESTDRAAVAGAQASAQGLPIPQVLPPQHPVVRIPPVIAAARQPAGTQNRQADPLPASQVVILTGLLLDQSGAVIPGAALQVKDEATGAVAKAVSAANGTFAFPGLKPGEHTLMASMPGFKQATLKGLQLAPGVPSDVRVTMLIGGTNETVTVQAGAETLQNQSATTSAQVGTTPRVNYGYGAGSGGGTGPGRAGGMGAAGGNVTIDGISAGPVKAAAQVSNPNEILFRLRYPRLDSIAEVGIARGRRIQEHQGINTESYDHLRDNPFQDVAQQPLSTFSIDVDTAAYANMRRYVNRSSLPPRDAVRLEELINYFDYDYPGPDDGKPFGANFEVTEAPWNPEHRLLRIGLKGREIRGSRPPGNLVFLLDVSGSMADANKLSLVKDSMLMLVDQLTEDDKVAIVVYATESRLLLPPTRGDQKQIIREAIRGLEAGGTTNGSAGIQLAYQIAQEGFLPKGTNRVILATDGDFNVGIVNRGELARFIEDKRRSGVFLSALGFGMGNLKDSTLEMLADKGNGNYAYIDTLHEARKVLVEQLNAALVTIAKDVKIQVEFNPLQVGAYRLIGYEDRLLSKESFNNDAKDAGEIGAGHAITVLYELVPADGAVQDRRVDPLKYQQPAAVATPAAQSGEMLTLKIRYKEPDQQESRLSEYVVRDAERTFAKASPDFKFAAAVAAFGMYLRDSPYKGRSTTEDILEWARAGQGADRFGSRQEFIDLLYRAFSIRYR
jgi:Ca-activated chloride channel family protein